MSKARRHWFALLIVGATAVSRPRYAAAQEHPALNRTESPNAAAQQSQREPAESRSLSSRVRSLFGRGRSRVKGEGSSVERQKQAESGEQRAEGHRVEQAQTRPSSIQRVEGEALRVESQKEVDRWGATSFDREPLTLNPQPPSSGAQPSTLNRPPSSQPSSLTDQEIARFEELAFANNPALAQARHAVDAAVGRLIQSGRYPNPTFGYVASEVGAEGRAGQQGVVIAQEIVRGCKLALSQAVACHARDQAEAQAAGQAWRLRNAVRLLYFEILAAQETKKLSDELVALAEQGVSVAQQREKAGEGTLTETLQAQIELDQVRILAATSAHNLRASWKRMAALVGRPEMDPEMLRGNLTAAREERDEAETFARMSAQSPEVQVADAGIRRADAAVARARAEPIPNVTLETSTQYDYGSNTQIAGIGISLPLPIWNRNEGNIMAAEAELRRSQREVDRVKLSLAERFAATYARFRNAQQQVDRYGRRLPDDEVERMLSLVGEDRQKELDRHAQILPRAQIALALATEGWRRGEFGYLQVLTAQRTLTQATLASVRAHAELRQSAVVLDGYLLTDGLGDPIGSGAGGPQSGVTEQ